MAFRIFFSCLLGLTYEISYLNLIVRAWKGRIKLSSAYRNPLRAHSMLVTIRDPAAFDVIVLYTKLYDTEAAEADIDV